eukprot:503522-Amphidinium_carterae.2
MCGACSWVLLTALSTCLIGSDRDVLIERDWPNLMEDPKYNISLTRRDEGVPTLLPRPKLRRELRHDEHATCLARSTKGGMTSWLQRKWVVRPVVDLPQR